MLRRGIWLVSATLMAAGGLLGAALAFGSSPSPWQSAAAPSLQRGLDLPANVYPSTSNYDCTPVTLRALGTASAQPDCVVLTSFGQVGAGGIVFNGATDSIAVAPKWPLYGLQAIPNNTLMFALSSAPIVDSYLHFFRSIYDKLPAAPEYVGGRWQYTLTAPQDFSLRGSDGKLLPVNQYAMAFSPHGSWLVVDIPWQGFVRVNLATFDIKPFAPSMQANGDYSDHRAQLAISNDGQNVVVKPSSWDELKVYDLSSCNTVSLPVSGGANVCPARDYWSTTGQITNFRGLYRPRFVNNTQLSFDAVHDYAGGTFQVTAYTLTAPGEDPSGVPYLGLGDSFASGEGAFEYAAGTDTAGSKCHLSSRSYPFLLSAQLYSGMHSIACSGAKMADVTSHSPDYDGQNLPHTRRQDYSTAQVNAFLAGYLPGYIAQSEFVDMYKPEAVTLSIGGNDIGFANILASCVSPVTSAESCYPTYEDRLELARQVNAIFDRLVGSYQNLLTPGKRVYVIGYPQIALAGGNCALNVRLDDHELAMAADLIDYLNLVISQAAAKAGARYVDVSQAFAGHRMCETASPDVAVNGFTSGGDLGLGPINFIGQESYHPNALGHQLLEQAVLRQTDNLRQAMPAADTSLLPPALPALDQLGLPTTGRTTNTVVNGDGMAPALLVHDQNVNVALDSSIAVLKALAAYRLVLHSDPVDLATVTSDAAGHLTASLTVPSSLATGFHVLHIYGPNVLGQPLDIVQTVYVAASTSDYNGDGVTNNADPCPFVTASGQDADHDAIDDACDPLIGLPPPVALSPLSSSVTLTDNAISLTLIKP